MTYTAQNVSYEELAEFGCDIFSDRKSRRMACASSYEDDNDDVVGILEETDVDLIRYFN